MGQHLSRVAARFERLREDGDKAFFAFIMAGDLPLERTVDIALAMERGSVDVLELGVPFSDPLADGPVIQRASAEALSCGVRLGDILEAVRELRRKSKLLVLLFSYYNLLLNYGLPRLVRDARDVGLDGVLVIDLPPEEAGEWLGPAHAAELDTVFMASPLSSRPHLQRVADECRGFVYAISAIGGTGERAALSSEALPLVQRLKHLTTKPVALGFGISTIEQLAAAAAADGVIVGSALVRYLQTHPDGDIAAQVRWLKSQIPQHAREVT